MAERSPVYPILNEINKAAANGMPFLALAMSVALPDICVSLEDEDGRTSSVKYKAWCKGNLPYESFSFVTADDLYSMRCGVLHNGRFGDLKNNVSRVVFAVSDEAVFVNCLANDIYIYSVVDFCRNFTDAVRTWFEANREDPHVQKNLPRLMQYRPGGMPPFIGLNMIA